MKTQNKDLSKMLKTAKKKGANISKIGSHIRVEYAGALIVVSSTPSDWRALRNIRSMFNRVGL